MNHALRVQLPAWVRAFLPPPQQVYASPEQRMRVAVALSRLNVEHGSGGPFGAAVFDLDRGVLIAVGVNLVLETRWSGAHAEMMALALAQQVLGTHDMSAPGMPRCELVSSAEPCAMCLGAVHWSGVHRLVCAARGSDVEAIGFDEGPKPGDWLHGLQARGVNVVRDLLRDEACAVLHAYRDAGGDIYNSRRPPPES